jgi:Asp-tRNA(Asn)/Glu-tRNA(Gln) amidotransferase A subunit family amidase
LDPQPTEFDGLVGPHPALAPAGKQWAISALERQAGCGLDYFGQFVLHVSDETDAASIISIEPAERGVLVHAVLERLAGQWLDLDKHLRPPWLQGDHLPAMRQRAVEILDELAAYIGIQHRLGHASAWGAERAHIMRSITAAIDAEAAEGSQPVACEHSFSGVMVAGAQFRGKIDRIDLMPDGGLRVTDFKTGVLSSLTDPLNGEGGSGSSSTLAAVAGYPSVTVPATQFFGLPVGLSFVGRPWSEAKLLALAADFEAATKARREPRFLPTLPLK